MQERDSKHSFCLKISGALWFQFALTSAPSSANSGNFVWNRSCYVAGLMSMGARHLDSKVQIYDKSDDGWPFYRATPAEPIQIAQVIGFYEKV